MPRMCGLPRLHRKTKDHFVEIELNQNNPSQDLRPNYTDGRSRLARGPSASMALTLASLVTSNAQQHLSLSVAPVDQGLRIEQLDGGKTVKLSPVGIQPIGYKSSASVTNGFKKWTVVPGVSNPAYVEKGILTLTNQSPGKFYVAQYPDFSKINGFLRIPDGMTPAQMTNPCGVSTWRRWAT